MMNLLFSILYSAHAKGTHHKIAMDALHTLSVPDADRWQKVFLKHADLYLEGSKAPDKEFKDFKNHVLHVRDNYWGGACEKAESWYANVVTALKEENWSEAVWAAGVLSHYYSDPIHPFHTAQSEAESNIHRAVEWSISKSYNTLRKIGLERHADLDVPMPTSDTWLREMVCAGAEKSNTQYERLIAHYDINTGVSDPPSGLDEISRALTAELLIYAAVGFSKILDRAIADAGVTPPSVNLTVDTVLAGLQIPVKWVLKRMEDAEERRAVEAMYDELRATGRVDVHLPEDDRIIRDKYEKEVASKARLRRVVERAELIARREKPKTARDTRKPSTAIRPPASTENASVAAAIAAIAPAPAAAQAQAPLQQQAPVAPQAATEPQQTPAAERAAPIAEPQPSLAEPKPEPAVKETTERKTAARPQRTYLEKTEDVEAAPSIGPKTAETLSTLGVLTVQDLLDADPQDIAARSPQRYITEKVVRDWQDQARLVMNVPGLRGSHAQLLVGAGYRTRDDVAAVDTNKLCADILGFAATSEGQRILRDGKPPEAEKITSWLESAQAAQADAA